MAIIPNKVGAASKADLLANAKSFSGTQIGAAFSVERVIGHLVNFVRQSFASKTLPVSNHPCVIAFVISPNLEDDYNTSTFKAIHRGLTADSSIKESDLLNRVILISQNGTAGAVSNTTFLSFQTQLDFIYTEFQKNILVIFHMDTPRYEVWLQGVINGVSYKTKLSITDGILEGSNLIDRLNEFDSEWINAQMGINKLWSHSSSYVPCLNTEKEIQTHLHCWLQASDARSVAISEVPNSAGRADLWIRYRSDEAQNSAIIELKVLREKHHHVDYKSAKNVSMEANKKAAKSAVSQANAYRTKLGTSRALACIFDMRKPPCDAQIINEAEAIATQKNVTLRSTQVTNNVGSIR